MTYKGSIAVDVRSLITGTPDLGESKHSISEQIAIAFADGVGANQAKNHFADSFSIVGAGTQTYDLAGSLTNGIGTVVFTAIKAIVIKNTGTAAITYGGGSTPFLGFLGDATDEIVVPAGGCVVLVDPTAAGQAVTAATGDLITLTGTDVAGQIIVIGETA